MIGDSLALSVACRLDPAPILAADRGLLKRIGIPMVSRLLLRGVAAAAILSVPAAVEAAPPPSSATEVCAECVKAHMERLAGDELRGRQCGTADEHAASVYLEAEMRRLGLKPAFEGGMRQKVALETPVLAAPPVLAAGGVRLTHGPDFLVLGDPVPTKGRLVRVTDPKAAPASLAGTVVFYDREGRDRTGIDLLLRRGAAAVLFPTDAALAAKWSKIAASIGPHSRVVGVEAPPSRGVMILLSKAAAEALRGVKEGTETSLAVRLKAPLRRDTYNVVAVLHGTEPDADRHALLLSAHYDHLGVNGGVIYHGADDDASGTTAVLEFARMLAAGPKPRRTVYFALFGCEEAGGLGAVYFRAHPPEKLTDFAMNLEFEMIGDDDPKRPGLLMLTGWNRSNLGPTLAAHGARIGPDLYPEQHFFQRSDNYQLALVGVVAQTVSAWPMPPTYHDPSDTLANIDFPFMDKAIGSMIGPVRWLVDSDFQPAWNPGMKP